jgi:hypothetical protein
MKIAVYRHTGGNFDSRAVIPNDIEGESASFAEFAPQRWATCRMGTGSVVSLRPHIETCGQHRTGEAANRLQSANVVSGQVRRSRYSLPCAGLFASDRH